MQRWRAIAAMYVITVFMLIFAPLCLSIILSDLARACKCMQLMLAEDGVGMDLYSAAFFRVADRPLSSQKRTACKYADVSQRKRHSHASLQRETRDGGVFFLSLMGAWCLNESRVFVCLETASHWQDNWSINAAKGQIIRWSQNNAGWLKFTDERSEALVCSSVQPLIISPSCVTEVGCHCDRISWTLTKFLSAWWANSGFRAL